MKSVLQRPPVLGKRLSKLPEVFWLSNRCATENLRRKRASLQFGGSSKKIHSTKISTIFLPALLQSTSREKSARSVIKKDCNILFFVTASIRFTTRIIW